MTVPIFALLIALSLLLLLLLLSYYYKYHIIIIIIKRTIEVLRAHAAKAVVCWLFMQ